MRNGRISVRLLRANLATHLKSQQPIAIGGPYELRAFLVPVPKHSNWDEKEKRKAIRAALSSFRKLLNEEM